MKKIGTYLRNLPTGVKWIVGINISIYIMTIFIFLVFGVKLQDYLGVYPTYSNNFNPIQLLSNMFTHSIVFDHIFFNMIFFLIFAPFVERSFGTKLFVLTYLVCGFFGFLFINYSYYKNKSSIEKSIVSIGINIKDIKISEFHVDEKYLNTLNTDQLYVIRDYNNVISKAYGASSSVFGILLIYIILNIKNVKKYFYVILAILLVYLGINGIKQNNEILNGSNYAHMGGVVGGFILIIIRRINIGLFLKS